jgi:hypothetical protein
MSMRRHMLAQTVVVVCSVVNTTISRSGVGGSAQLTWLRTPQIESTWQSIDGVQYRCKMGNSAAN